jgi:signal transduction histidine kinase
MSRAAAFAGFDALPAQVVVLDAAGEVVYSNAAWQAFAAANGYRGDPSSVGENYLAACDVDAPAAAAAAAGIREVLDGDRQTATVEYPCHGPDEKRWFVMRAGALDHGGRAHAVVIHLDVTERKLAQLSAERTAERLGDVARILSHDLRNPLSVARGYAEMLAADGDGDDDRVGQVLSALDRMDRMVEDALTFARPGGVEETRLVDLETVARRAWDHVDTGGAALAVTDTFEFAADPDRLDHVFENLFRNSVEHGSTGSRPEAGDGGGQDATGAPADAGEDDLAVAVTVGPIGDPVTPDGFFVADDGPGLPTTDPESLFEPGDAAGGGSGLGLSIVARLVADHGWSVRATASADGGARFEVTGVEAVV